MSEGKPMEHHLRQSLRCSSSVVRMVYEKGGFMSFLPRIAVVFLALVYFSDAHLTDLDWIAFPISVMLVYLTGKVTDGNILGEKFIVAFLVVTICLVSLFVNLLADHPCTLCFLDIPDVIRIPTPGESLLTSFEMFMDTSDAPRRCAQCVLVGSTLFGNASLLPRQFSFFEKKLLGDYRSESLVDFYSDESEREPIRTEMKTRVSGPQSLAIGPKDHRQLDAWYAEIQKSTSPKGAVKRFLLALAADPTSDVGRELLRNMTHDFLCYPAGRLNGPKPSEFLHNLKTPRFTAEEIVPGDGPLEVDFESLKSIMIGEKMQELNPDVCAMIRLAHMIPEDASVLKTGVNAANLDPVANETVLKGIDGSFIVPALYVPRLDEDKDPEGKTSDMTEAAFSLYQRLPMDDGEAVYFDTREEYIAFFRWSVEHKLQDEFYFPKWLALGNGTDSKAAEQLRESSSQLLADQFKFRNDRQRIFDATSDSTLSDRAFYGAAMKTMCAIKLPGDPDYGFLTDPSYYTTPKEVEYFRTEAMPSKDDILQMAAVFYGGEIELEALRKMVVQVDYSLVSHWEYREAFERLGTILYLDADSRKPIGVWLTHSSKMVLPTAGMLWEHAKYSHRSTEMVMAAMIHVMDYHLGWANRFSNAMRQTLPPTHGLRMMMKPHVHGSALVNWNAYQMLIMDDSVLLRANGLKRRAHGQAWGHLLKHSDMVSTFPEILAAKHLGGVSNLTETLPYFVQATKVWNIHLKYVTAFLELLFPDDAMLENDPALKRFWHHLNSLGRHADPCVCDMDSAAFYTPDVWPAFEDTRTCAGLMDIVDFEVTVIDKAKRRDLWCKGNLPIERTQALHRWLQKECEEHPKCPEISYQFEHMRPSMNLPEMNRENVVRLVTRFIFEVTLGHEMVADNLPFIVDPAYGGVTRRKVYDETKQPMADINTWIFGVVISALTTIRSLPLLADWSGLLLTWVDTEEDLVQHSDADRWARKETLKDLHLTYKTELVMNANAFVKESLKRPQNQWSPFLNPSVQAASIAV